MQTFADASAPRQHLRFEELPRGFLPFPEHIVEMTARRREQDGFSDDYFRDSLERHTLAWFYDGLPVAYRPGPGGIEILAVGFEEVAAYEREPEPGAKVVQAG